MAALLERYSPLLLTHDKRHYYALNTGQGMSSPKTKRSRFLDPRVFASCGTLLIIFGLITRNPMEWVLGGSYLLFGVIDLIRRKKAKWGRDQ
jgi:hypothetical protein